ncbi:MAG: OstA-like protein [Bacteroidota bacterium]
MQVLQRILLFFGGLVWPLALGAQTAKPGVVSPNAVEADTTKKDEVDIIHADVFEFIQQKPTVIQKLLDNVELKQDSVFMYCDTATIINSTNVRANGQVLIQQGDSLSVFSDSLVYDGALREAELFGDVILVNGNQRLFTDRLSYDLNTKVATYFSGATLTNDSTQLTSKKGYYYVDQQEAYFKDSVVVVDPQFVLRSDTLLFNTESKTVFFLGPTLISSDSNRIYCEDGFYDTQEGIAEFRQNAQYVKGEQKAVADTIRYEGSTEQYILQGNASFEENDRRAQADIIRYDEKNDKTFLTRNATYRDETQNITSDEIVYDAKKEVYSTKGRSRIVDPPQILLADQVDYSEEAGLGIAKGNVIWNDTSANLTIVCEQADYDRKTDYLKAMGGRDDRPLLISILEGDSLFLTADTLLSLKEDTLATDSSRALIAFNDVRVYKSDLQSLCDSMVYTSSDSIFRFFNAPIIWSDTSQFTADTIHMKLANEKLDKIFLYNNAFIINSPDELFFNQVKGKNITATFEEDELRRMDVSGNAESVYYAIDEFGGYVGVNETICSDMVLLFGDNQVEKIKFLAAPQATLHPMKQVDHDKLKIKGFNWQSGIRPRSIDDLYGEKPQRVLLQLPGNELRNREFQERYNKGTKEPKPELKPKPQPRGATKN